MPKSEKITVQVNGETRLVDSNTNISDLLAELNINHPAVAVEVNSEIKPRSRFASVHLKSGDIVEVVSLVGGG